MKDPKKSQPLTPGSTGFTLPPVNRKLRRAMRYGHTLKPEFGQTGYKQRVRREGE